MKTLTRKYINGITDQSLKDDTLFLEFDKQGKLENAIKQGLYAERNEKFIKNAFNFGNGTIKDFNRYVEDNKKYAEFIQVI